MTNQTNNCNLSFDEALAKFLEGSQSIVDNEFKDCQNLSPKLITSKGRRYVRVISSLFGGEQRSAYCFVDRTNGNVLKAASWKSPAKGIRGNIYRAKHGVDAVTAYGAVYFR